MAYPSIPARPDPLANWTALGDAWHAALTQALSDDPAIRADLTAVKGTVAGLVTGLAPTANPSFTGTVSGISKGMVGLGAVDNTADNAKALDGTQLVSGTLEPQRIPARVAAMRFRTPANELNPSATNWQPRPTGYQFVAAVGAPPAPADQLGDDLHIPTTAPPPTGPQPITLTDGSTIPVWPGSEAFNRAQLIGAVTTSITHQPTYDAYTSRLPANKLLDGFRGMAANVCSLLYTSQSQVPKTYPTVTLEFTGTAGVLAQTWRTATPPRIEFGPGSIGASVTASYSTHEVVHLFQRYPTNVTTQTSGVTEGIADWVLVQMGYHYASAHRPADGGTAWDAGYDTTAFFLDYIEKVAGGGTPGFVRALNASLNAATWNASAITSLNTQGKTVTQLWADYKAWLNPAPTPQASGLAGSWTLSLQDEFDGTAVNSANWNRLRGTPNGLYDSPYNPSMDDSSWDASYATVSDGLLRLRWARVPSESYGITYPYTAGLVTSEGLKSFTPPVFIEARIWFTDTPGLWPAFWMDPVVGWPPEIDIAEFVPDDTPDGLYKPHFNYHWSEGGQHKQMGWRWYGTQGQSIAGAWHTYGLHWTSSRLQVYLDGQPGPSYTGTGITSQPMYIILSTGVRRGFLPAAGEMRVDYVRAWTPA